MFKGKELTMKTNRVLIAGILLLSVSGVFGVCPPLDFEDYPVNTVITTQYPGVTFSAPHPGGSVSGACYLKDMTNLGGTSSGVKALVSRPAPGYEFSPQMTRMVFDVSQWEVTFTLGPGAGPSTGTYYVRSYSSVSGGTLLETQTVQISGLPGVRRLVRMEAVPSGMFLLPIRRIEIEEASGGLYEGIDDLDYDKGGSDPTAEITQPGHYGCICDLVSIYGKACDADGDSLDIDLDYKYLETSGQTWQSILSQHGVVQTNCGTRLIKVWDTTGLSEGRYLLRLRVMDVCEGEPVEDMQVVYVSKAFDDLEVRRPVDGGVYGGNVCIDGSAWDEHYCFDSYRVDYKTDGGSWQPVNPAEPVYTSTVINDPLAVWDTIGLGIPDGEYKVRVQATDDCGHVGTQTREIKVDNTAPVAKIAEPLACEFIWGSVSIFGTVMDENLGSWVLQYTGNGWHNWVTIASGNTEVPGGLLAVWDTSGLNACAYTLRLIARDTAVRNCNSVLENETQTTTSVVVGLPGDLNFDWQVNLADFEKFSNYWLYTP